MNGAGRKRRHPSAGDKVIKAAVDFLQLRDENIHATLTGFSEKIRAVRALPDLTLSFCDVVDLDLVPVPGPLHHLQARQQRILLLLQLFHLFQPKEKVQCLAAVQAAAEGDEDGGVSSPHSRPGRARLPDRVLYFHQAPGPNPAHYHQGSDGPSWPGWEGRRARGEEEEEEEERGQGGREEEEGGGSVSQSLQTQGKGDGDGNKQGEKRERR